MYDVSVQCFTFSAHFIEKKVEIWIIKNKDPCFYCFMPAALAVCTPSLRSCPVRDPIFKYY